MTKCEKWLDSMEYSKHHSLTKDSMVKFMIDALNQRQCDPIKIKCQPCQEERLGFYVPEQKEIILCSNHISSKTQMQDTMTHELIHAFDDCTAKVNWKNHRHVACSEIRAAALSGDCKFTREFARGNVGFIKHFQTCVKRRAILSLEPHAGKDAAKIIESVWEPCFKDTSPFDEIP